MPEQTKEKYYALTHRGDLVLLGEFEDFEDADNEAERNHGGAIYLFGQETAQEWRDALNKLMEGESK